MAQLYRIIVHAADGAYYQGPVTFADAQIMLNNSIAAGEVETGSFLMIARDFLIIAPPNA
jgi:hypothetical protein